MAASPRDVIVVKHTAIDTAPLDASAAPHHVSTEVEPAIVGATSLADDGTAVAAVLDHDVFTDKTASMPPSTTSKAVAFDVEAGHDNVAGSAAAVPKPAIARAVRSLSKRQLVTNKDATTFKHSFWWRAGNVLLTWPWNLAAVV